MLKQYIKRESYNVILQDNGTFAVIDYEKKLKLPTQKTRFDERDLLDSKYDLITHIDSTHFKQAVLVFMRNKSEQNAILEFTGDEIILTDTLAFEYAFKNKCEKHKYYVGESFKRAFTYVKGSNFKIKRTESRSPADIILIECDKRKIIIPLARVERSE